MTSRVDRSLFCRCGQPHTPELSVVMPVYNEGNALEAVLHDWTALLDSLGICYQILICDDGSREDTGVVLERLAGEIPGVAVYGLPHRGHGPTILAGYRAARGSWVFQTDSDGDMDVAGLRELWIRRDDHDFLLGYRQGRSWTMVRWMVTHGSRLLVRLLFGKGISDVNSPFRLMRQSWLQDQISDLDDDLFAPNVILSARAVRTGARIFETPVRFIGRRQGTSSLAGLAILRPALRATVETLAAARRLPRTR